MLVEKRAHVGQVDGNEFSIPVGKRVRIALSIRFQFLKSFIPVVSEVVTLRGRSARPPPPNPTRTRTRPPARALIPIDPGI